MKQRMRRAAPYGRFNDSGLFVAAVIACVIVIVALLLNFGKR